MDATFCPSLDFQDDAFLFDCESFMDKSYDPLACDAASDPGYFSAASSLSPTSSVDSFCFSPMALQANPEDALDCLIFGSAPAAAVAPHPVCDVQTPPCAAASRTSCSVKKSRSRYPGKKRQTASEREKLRMRDLTKALHHLRAYLPPSVAPAGQTLTKIETLRLTIRYISYLSAQLGLSEEALEQRRCVGFAAQPQTLDQCLAYSPQEAAFNAVSAASSSPLQHSYPVPSGVCFDQYWLPQQHLQNVTFPGQC